MSGELEIRAEYEPGDDTLAEDRLLRAAARILREASAADGSRRPVLRVIEREGGAR